MKAPTPFRHYKKAEVVDAYAHASNPNNTDALVVVDGLFDTETLDRLSRVKYPSLDAIRAILFEAAPDLMEAWAIARENIAMALSGSLLDVEPARGSVYEELPFVRGEGYDEYRLDNRGFIEVFSAFTVIRGISRFNALRFPETIEPQRIVDDQDDLEAELWDFREMNRKDHTDWENSLVEVTRGDQVLVPGLPRPTMYATYTGDSVNSSLLRNLWLTHNPADGKLADLVAEPAQLGWLDHRSF